MVAKNTGSAPFLETQSTKPKRTRVDFLKNHFQIFEHRNTREDLYITKPSWACKTIQRCAIVEEDMDWGSGYEY